MSRATPTVEAAPARGASVAAYAAAGAFHVTLWGTIAALLFGAAWFGVVEPRPVFGISAWAVGVWCGLSALFLVLAQFASDAPPRFGRALRREEAPGLFALVDEVRGELGVAPVREIRVKAAPVLGVGRTWRRGGMVRRENRVLVVGLPNLRDMTVDELRAAIAHELAHFAGGDVRRGRIVNDAWNRVARMRAALAAGGLLLTWPNPLWWYVRFWGALLRVVSGAIRRGQEYRADALAAQACGAAVYARSLARCAGLNVAFRRLAPGLVYRARRDGRRPTNLFRELHESAERMAPGERRRIVRQALEDVGSVGDEHPALRQRLAAIGVRRIPRRVAGERPAAELVPALASLEEELTPALLRGLALSFRERLRRRRERHEAALAAATASAAADRGPASA